MACCQRDWDDSHGSAARNAERLFAAAASGIEAARRVVNTRKRDIGRLVVGAGEAAVELDDVQRQLSP